MLFIRMCFDDDTAGDLRSRTLKSHRGYISTYLRPKNGVQVVQGGPMCTDENCTGTRGSFLVVEAESIADVQAFHDNDPFTKAGLFSSHELIRWDRHIGNDPDEEYVP